MKTFATLDFISYKKKEKKKTQTYVRNDINDVVYQNLYVFYALHYIVHYVCTFSSLSTYLHLYLTLSEISSATTPFTLHLAIVIVAFDRIVGMPTYLRARRESARLYQSYVRRTFHAVRKYANSIGGFETEIRVLLNAYRKYYGIIDANYYF